LREPSLKDAYRGLLARRQAPALVDIYRKRERYPDLVDLSEALLDHDEAFTLWRARHVQMVERQIGAKPGTGGSSGVAYLQSTLSKRFFPELWEVRSQL
jgi:tryptophan 2,3-dioxygenase